MTTGCERISRCPRRSTGSDAECAFTVVHRGLTAEGGVQEHGLPTFPSRRFVDASDGTAGLALVHDGLLEYEVVDDGRELALTLLRSVGYLSRSEPSLRPNPAGPTVEVRGAQMPGTQRAEYAVLLHTRRLAGRRLLRRGRRVPRPVRTGARGRRRRRRPRPAPRCASTAPRSSAVLRSPGGLVVRVFRTDADAGPVAIEHDGAPARGWIIDLQGRPVAPFEGSVDAAPVGDLHAPARVNPARRRNPT